MIILSIITILFSVYILKKISKFKVVYYRKLIKNFYIYLIMLSMLLFSYSSFNLDEGLDNFIILVCGFLFILLINNIMCIFISIFTKEKFKFNRFIIFLLSLILYGVFIFMMISNIKYLLALIIYIFITLFILFVICLILYISKLKKFYLIYSISLLSMVIGLFIFYITFDFTCYYVFVILSSALLYLGTFYMLKK